jgi:hypothetical protein
MPLFAALVLRERPIVEDEMRRLDEILKDLPQPPARSRLDPFGSLIKELIDIGWTYWERRFYAPPNTPVLIPLP